jgi:hypothetical protein
MSKRRRGALLNCYGVLRPRGAPCLGKPVRRAPGTAPGAGRLRAPSLISTLAFLLIRKASVPNALILSCMRSVGEGEIAPFGRGKAPVAPPSSVCLCQEQLLSQPRAGGRPHPQGG